MSKTYSLKVALVGEPNVGKSTLINSIVGEKVSIVTHKAQTTREVVRGILTKDDKQLVFLDTPGIFQASKSLEKKILRNALVGIDEAELVLLMINPKVGVDERITKLVAKLKSKEKAAIAVINKVDTIPKPKLIEIAVALDEFKFFDQIYFISALKKKGLEEIIKYLFSKTKPGKWMFDAEILTDATERKFAEEITREQLFILLHQELPYTVNVITEKWEEQEDGSVKIYQAINILKAAHKSIIVGANGRLIKQIGKNSRIRLSKHFGRPVHLFLYVKVEEDWVEKF